eukprot:gene9750-15135_t
MSVCGPAAPGNGDGEGRVQSPLRSPQRRVVTARDLLSSADEMLPRDFRHRPTPGGGAAAPPHPPPPRKRGVADVDWRELAERELFEAERAERLARKRADGDRHHQPNYPHRLAAAKSVDDALGSTGASSRREFAYSEVRRAPEDVERYEARPRKAHPSGVSPLVRTDSAESGFNPGYARVSTRDAFNETAASLPFTAVAASTSCGSTATNPQTLRPRRLQAAARGFDSTLSSVDDSTAASDTQPRPQRILGSPARVQRPQAGGGRPCKFFTARPALPESVADDSAFDTTLTGPDAQLVRIHHDMVQVERKLARAARPVQKRMQYRSVTSGTKPTLTTNEEVLERAPLISEAELTEEVSLLQSWGQLRSEFDVVQRQTDTQSKKTAVRRSAAFLSVNWRFGLFIPMLAALAVLALVQFESYLLFTWLACSVLCVSWALALEKQWIPMWLTFLVAGGLCYGSVSTIMASEGGDAAEANAGAALVLPLVIAAMVILFFAFTTRESFAINELNTADNESSDPIFQAIIAGDLPWLQREATAAPWKLRRRDAMSATPLHAALLRSNSSRKHREMANWMIQHMPFLALDVYTDKVFQGVSCLHFAIIHRDKAAVHRFANTTPHSLTCRAVGSFFSAKDTYYGEWPLLSAVCSNQPDIVAYLLQIGAERLRWPEAQQLRIRDGKRNSILHVSVMHNLPHMYDYLCHLLERYGVDLRNESDEGVYNDDLLTPFTLAAHIGQREIFEHLVEKATDEVWQMGSCRCRRMWLDEIDSVNTKGRHVVGVLQMLVDLEKTDLLMIPAMKELLLVKWQAFAERLWLHQFALLMVFVLAYSVVVFYGPLVRYRVESTAACARDGGIWYPGMDDPPWWSVAWCELSTYPLQGSCELVVVLGTFYQAFVEIRRMAAVPTSVYFGKKGSLLLEQVSVWGFCLSVSSAIACRLLGLHMYEDLALAIGALALWCHVLHELLGFRGTGPFVVMIWKMLGSDLMRFLIIFACFLLGFTQALYLLVNKYGAYYFFKRLMGCFVALLGQADISSLIIDEDSSNFPFISTALLMIYVLMVSILLLNLLVAMMTTTYSKIYDESDKVWNLEWARLVVTMESQLTTEQKSAKRYKYWGESVTETGTRRFFLLPSMRQEDKEVFSKATPTWPPDAPHSIVN